MKRMLAVMIVTGCSSHPCAPDGDQLDSGDPLDGYCAAVHVETTVAHDTAVAVLGYSVAADQPIATPLHPEPTEHFAVLELVAAPRSDGDEIVEWSPFIDEGWRPEPIVAYALKDGYVVATGGSHLDVEHPDGDPTYYDATVSVDAGAVVELWGNATTTFEGGTRCARWQQPSGTVFFFVAHDDWDCDGVANAIDPTPNGG